MRCFGSFRQAIRYATGGSVELSRRADLRASEPALRRIAGTASSPLLGIEYDSIGYGGASLTLRGSGGPGCTDGYTYSFGNLGTYGWNDRAASARTYSNCVGVHYRDRSLGGPSVSVFGSSSSLGSLNNQVSSVRFY